MIISLLMNTPLYSVRMRASCHGQHLTGAERIVPEAAVSDVTAALTARAMSPSNESPEEIHCSVEKIEPEHDETADCQGGGQAFEGRVVGAGSRAMGQCQTPSGPVRRQIPEQAHRAVRGVDGVGPAPDHSANIPPWT